VTLNHEHHNNISDVTVTHHTDHVTLQNANDIVDIAKLVDQVVASRDAQMNLYDSIHAS